MAKPGPYRTGRPKFLVQTTLIDIRVTMGEIAAIRQEAAKAGLPMALFLRRALGLPDLITDRDIMLLKDEGASKKAVDAARRLLEREERKLVVKQSKLHRRPTRTIDDFHRDITPTSPK